MWQHLIMSSTITCYRSNAAVPPSHRSLKRSLHNALILRAVLKHYSTAASNNVTRMLLRRV